MPETQPCPHCGALIQVESLPLVEARKAEGQPPERGEALDLPPVPLLAPGSQDDTFSASTFGGKIALAEPDPILGEFVTPSSSPSAPAFPAIDLGSSGGQAHAEGSAKPGQVLEIEGEEDDAPLGRRASWALVLLASYASAITLGLAWTVLRTRAPEKPQPKVDRPPVVAVAESARQVGLSRKVDRPEPILGEHFATMGRPLQVGSLEITPIDVKRQAVTLRRSNPYAKDGSKEGGKGALVLRLRLKNLSSDAAFAPLDQAYLRERGKGIVDTFVQTATDERVYPFPLAVESEWSIIGQDFTELRPGESRVVSIASAAGAPPDSAGPFTWRVRLRTGINRTDAIGLRWPENVAGTAKASNRD